MPINEIATVADLGSGYNSGSFISPVGDPSGALVVMDFFTKMILDGHGFQIRAGTITTPLVGDVAITDTAAEFCADPPAGFTILPVFQNVAVRLATGTLHEYATKSILGVSTAGTAFVPLPLLTGGAAASTTARVQAAGAVTVVAELATNTRRHWEWANPAAGFTGALPGDWNQRWEPRHPPAIRSVSGALYCLYTQIAATTTGPSYYAHLDFLEMLNAQFGLA